MILEECQSFVDRICLDTISHISDKTTRTIGILTVIVFALMCSSINENSLLPV